MKLQILVILRKRNSNIIKHRNYIIYIDEAQLNCTEKSKKRKWFQGSILNNNNKKYATNNRVYWVINCKIYSEGSFSVLFHNILDSFDLIILLSDKI